MLSDIWILFFALFTPNTVPRSALLLRIMLLVNVWLEVVTSLLIYNTAAKSTALLFVNVLLLISALVTNSSKIIHVWLLAELLWNTFLLILKTPLWPLITCPVPRSLFLKVFPVIWALSVLAYINVPEFPSNVEFLTTSLAALLSSANIT